MQSGKQLDDNKENGKRQEQMIRFNHRSINQHKIVKHRTQNDNQVKQDSERQGSKQSHQNNAINKTERQNDQVQNTHHAERNGSRNRHNRMMLINHNIHSGTKGITPSWIKQHQLQQHPI